MQKTKTCSECGSKEIIFKDNEIYCRKCGLVLDDKPIVNKTGFIEEGEKPGHGPKRTYLEPGFETYISTKDINNINKKKR